MTDPPKYDAFEYKLTEIGRITTTWAKFEHWIDQAIWILADVDARKGACVTTQINSIHGKFRALLALMNEANRPKDAIDAAGKLSNEAAKIVQIRTRFAHGPLDMGLNFDKREFEVYLRQINTTGRNLTFLTAPLTDEELAEANQAISGLYMKLLEVWPLIVGVSHINSLAPPHE